MSHSPTQLHLIINKTKVTNIKVAYIKIIHYGDFACMANRFGITHDSHIYISIYSLQSPSQLSGARSKLLHFLQWARPTEAFTHLPFPSLRPKSKKARIQVNNNPASKAKAKAKDHNPLSNHSVKLKKAD